MIFKKGTYIITTKGRFNYASCFLLAEDFNPLADNRISYVNYFDVYYKPRTKNVVKYVRYVYDDNNGGHITFELSDNLHYAPKNVIALCEMAINEIEKANS